MAGNEAGSVEVKVLPDATVAEWRAHLEPVAEQIKLSAKVNLKLSKGAVGALVTDVQADLNKRKTLPKLAVKLHVPKSEVRRAVKEINAHTKTLEKRPSINVGISITQKEIKRAINEANAALLAANRQPPKLKVLVDLDENQQKLVKETVVHVREIDAKLRASGAAIQIPVELDEDSLNEIQKKALIAHNAANERIREAHQKRLDGLELLEEESRQRRRGSILADLDFETELLDRNAKLLEQKRVDRAAGIEDRVLEARRKNEDKITLMLRENLDARSLEHVKHANKVALLHERAELAQQSSSLTTLRRLRNDLSQFDATTTRLIRRSSLVFGVFTAGVAASFAGIAGFALKSFADTEQQLRRTAAVLGTDVFSKTMADLSEQGVTGARAQERAFADFRKEVNRTGKALQDVVNLTALGTVFDQTEIATGTRALAQAGLTIDQIKVSMLGVAQFAQNEELLPEEAVQSLVQGATAAGESLKELTYLADRFTFVANNTTASATEVADAFANRAAPQFRAYGESVNSTLAILNLFAAAGIKGKTAGEQAGILIREVNKAATKTAATAEAFRKYGIEVGKVNGVQVPFARTLGQLATLLDNVRTQRGSLEMARLRKELGLTEKSGAGLLQLLPQVVANTGGSAEKAIRNIENLQKQIAGSAGATARQASVLMDSLSFQTDLLSNQITSMFKAAARPGGEALTKVFRELNGEVKVVNGELVQTGGFAEDLQEKFTKVGQRLSDAIVPAIRRFAVGGEGEAFFKGIFDMYAGFLGGLRDAFGAFRKEVYGEGSNKGFFSTFGDGMAALGRFAAETLPRIGRLFGFIVSIVRENTAAAEMFIKVWAGLFLASRALRLFIIPLTGLATQIGAVLTGVGLLKGSKIAGWATAATASITGMTAATTANAGAANAAAAANARLAASHSIAMRGAMAGGLGGLFSTGALAMVGRVDKAVAGLVARFARFGTALGFIAKWFLPVTFAVGILKGAIDQLNGAMGGDGNVSGRDFINTLKSIGGAIAAVIRPIVSAIGWVTKLVFWFGKFIGAGVMQAVISAVKILGDAFELCAEKVRGISRDFNDFLMKFEPMRQYAKALGDTMGWLGDRMDDAAAGGGSAVRWLGEQSRELARAQRDVYGQTNALSPMFDRMADSMIGAERSGEGLALTMMRVNRVLRAETYAATEAARDQYRVLGVANDAIIPKYLKLTAAQKAMRHSTETAARVATNLQKRQAQLAYISDLLAGKVKNAAAMQDLMAGSSAKAERNLAALVGGEDKLQSMLSDIAAGNKRAAKSFIAFSTTAQQAAIAKAKVIIRSARAEMAAISAAAQVNMRASVVLGLQQGRLKQAQRLLKENESFVKNQKDLVDSLTANAAIGDIPEIANAETEAAEKAAKSARKKAAANREVKTAAEKAEAAVNKLTIAQFRSVAQGLISKIGKMPGVYKATAYEAAVLAKAMPAVDRAIERQTAMVTKLDEALQALQGTQLLGTKAASDEAFAFDQEVKALQLQKIDLQIAGVTGEDPAVKAIDEQIAAIQLRAERAALAAAVAMDPLKKQLEETFTPVKELSFDEIIGQFTKLNSAREKAQGSLTKTEALKKKLDEVVAAQADKFSNIGLNVSRGIVAGTKAGAAGVTKAAKDTAANLTSTTRRELGIASPSRVMAQIGLQSSQGFEGGIRSGLPRVIAAATEIRRGAVNALLAGQPFFEGAGRRVMASFLAGMKEKYEGEGGVQEFVKEIAVWIRANKGPISYDAQLLRPAGEAIMSGFHRGLDDGFREVKGWVKGVAGQIGDNFPKELMFERSARFLLNNAKADATFTPEDAFGDLIGDMLGGIGVADPTLSFLHKTLSAADTKEMTQRLLALYPGLNFDPSSSQFLRPAGTRTSAGFVSDHTEGTAVDIGTGGPMPTAASRALFAKLKPLIGTVFKQLIHAGLGLSAGGGTFLDRSHWDHIHAAFLKGDGFAKWSNKKGSNLNIPGLPPDIAQALLSASQKTGVPAQLLAAIAKQESGWRAQIGSPAGAQGLMQLMPATARGLGVTNVNDPFQNALGGAKYIKQQLERFSGNIRLALAAYNAGPNAPGLAIGQLPPYGETRHYVQAVLEYLRKFGGIGNFRAQGGHVNASMPTWVGERGRELWVPDRGGTVISNQNIEALIRLAQQGKVGDGQKQIIYSPQFDVRSNAADPAAVAAQVDARMRAQIVKVSR